MGFVGEVVFVSGSRFCCCYEYICKFGCPVSFEEDLDFFVFFCFFGFLFLHIFRTDLLSLTS